MVNSSSSPKTVCVGESLAKRLKFSETHVVQSTLSESLGGTLRRWENALSSGQSSEPTRDPLLSLAPAAWFFFSCQCSPGTFSTYFCTFPNSASPISLGPPLPINPLQQRLGNMTFIWLTLFLEGLPSKILDRPKSRVLTISAFTLWDQSGRYSRGRTFSSMRCGQRIINM